ncbi:transmembrane protein 255B isoform X4 [Perognathus longimembris pacificus]|uniref:transmembrane protein 255B isoform X4 n=1 Tax=Perognathus longimembris pacificus TaxID=214514 RepID=UPI0020188DA8|nr:transmembrane protein 255B isoform X4 [Perognathus longimembris pacificus]
MVTGHTAEGGGDAAVGTAPWLCPRDAATPATRAGAPGSAGHRRLCQEEEDLPVVCGVSAAGVHPHSDHRPCCYHQDRECDGGGLLPWDHRFGAFLGLIGINLVENRRQMLVAAIVFISFGVVAAFCCAIVDGVFAARHIELRPLSTGRCQFYSSGTGYLYDVYETEVTCYSLNGRCQLKVRSNTCYCCDLYACGSTEHSPAYYEFVGVQSCQDVAHLYRLLWVSTVLNVLGLCTGIITAAVLGAFKDMVPLSQLAYGPSPPPPQILYNPAQQILAYPGFCPPPSTVPTCSSYPLPLQPSGTLPASASADLSLPEDLRPPSQGGSSQGQLLSAPPLRTPACFLPGEKPPPYTP